MYGTRSSACMWLPYSLFVFVVIIVYQLNTRQTKKCKLGAEEEGCPKTIPLWNQSLDFYKLDISNETGNPTGCYIVPNFVHFVYFGGKPITYAQLLCVLAALKNQKPEKIFFHYDNVTTFTGKYWEVLERTQVFNNITVLNRVTPPTEIFGTPISKRWLTWHGSDIVRIQMLMRYGGIYLDNDCYIVKSIDEFRRFEISLYWDDDDIIMNAVIIAHKDARFLGKWMDTYRDYDGTKFVYNSGERPQEVLNAEPEILHRVQGLFGMNLNLVYKLFDGQWGGWRKLYIVHLLTRHTDLIRNRSAEVTYPVEFNETNVGYYPVTFREMAYELYDAGNITWPKNRFELFKK